MGKHSAKRTHLGPVRTAMLSMTALVTAAVAAEHGTSEGAQENRAIEATTSWTDLESHTGVLAKVTADRMTATGAEVQEQVAPAPAPEVVADTPVTDTPHGGIPLTYENTDEQPAPKATAVADTKSTVKSEKPSSGHRGGKHRRVEAEAVARKSGPSAAPAAPDLGQVLTSIAQVLGAGANAGGALAQALGSGSAALGTGSASVAPVADVLGSGSGEGVELGKPLAQLAKALGSGSAALGTGSAQVSKAGTSLIAGFTPPSDTVTPKPRHAAPEPEEDTSDSADSADSADSSDATDSGDSTETAVG
ncbi:hypothetical protein NDR87_15150 [Nocardia sp. CDC159]|uniref:Uncharacterized protein n=1 Tax=Nocardia pulmonis TaxID=2951408 RepID=A0A9X2E765_9NOCA|nr:MULTISPECIES: hypothetical protein [Nocardia]MCM6775572.1 hypothetical protein [Nocardia pulmonis]MCM6787694.1 hypothetical protein [Nocardia sp. CDC159]